MFCLSAIRGPAGINTDVCMTTLNALHGFQGNFSWHSYYGFESQASPSCASVLFVRLSCSGKHVCNVTLPRALVLWILHLTKTLAPSGVFVWVACHDRVSGCKHRRLHCYEPSRPDPKVTSVASMSCHNTGARSLKQFIWLPSHTPGHSGASSALVFFIINKVKRVDAL